MEQAHGGWREEEEEEEETGGAVSRLLCLSSFEWGY